MIKGIKSYVGVSLIDYPGIISSLLFLGGCNMSCNFCHNKALALAPDNYPDIPFSELKKELKECRKFVDGCTVTGGEPTINRGLDELLEYLRVLDYKIKLDTNGLNFSKVKDLVKNRLVDYVAVDIKTAPSNYGLLGAKPGSEQNLIKTVYYLKTQKKVAYELRTTFIPEFVNKNVVEEMATLVDGAENYYLQGTENVDRHKMKSFAESLLSICKVKHFDTRNF